MIQKTFLAAIVAFTMLTTSLAAVFAYDDDSSDNDNTIEVQYLWLIDGKRTFYDCEVPETAQGTTIAICHDHEIIDMKNNRVIGRATDATADIDTDFAGGGIVATGTTFFHLPQGSFTVRGRGTIQPTLVGNPMLNAAPVTNIAGIFPDAGMNNVIDGSGVFKGVEGTFTLLGALDTTKMNEGESQFFCVFVIDLKLKRSKIEELEESGAEMGIFSNLLNEYYED